MACVRACGGGGAGASALGVLPTVPQMCARAQGVMANTRPHNRWRMEHRGAAQTRTAAYTARLLGFFFFFSCSIGRSGDRARYIMYTVNTSIPQLHITAFTLITHQYNSSLD